MRNPSITVTPLRRVNVLGEVRQPGMYTVDPTVSLVGAVALAGGHTQEGNLRDVTVVREGAVIRNRPALGASLQDLDMRSGDEIYVERVVRSSDARTEPVAIQIGVVDGSRVQVLSGIAEGDEVTLK